jgi:uncharacterized Zn-finger protein
MSRLSHSFSRLEHLPPNFGLPYREKPSVFSTRDCASSKKSPRFRERGLLNVAQSQQGLMKPAASLLDKGKLTQRIGILRRKHERLG